MGSEQLRMVIRIGSRDVGSGNPPYVIAEMSGNHGHSLQTALQIVERAAQSGAHAIKLQTYTPDTLTLNSHKPEFFLPPDGSIWKGMRLWDLYESAYTPWEWHAPIFERGRALGLDCISTAFDQSSVEFLRELGVDAIKVASFELINLPLIRMAASIGVPLIMSTGMATVAEIDDAVKTARAAGNRELILLKCTSAYPAAPADAHLATMPDLARRFGCVVGLSDHTLTNTGVVSAVALGAAMIEKHFTLDRAAGGPDSTFSLEPAEFRAMVDAAFEAHASLGQVHYGASEAEAASLWERPSIYVVKPIAKGGRFSAENLRIIRPGGGLLPKFYERVLGLRAAVDIAEDTPLARDMIEDGEPKEVD